MDRNERQRAALDQILQLVYLLNEDLSQSLARDDLTPSRVPIVWALRDRGPTTQRALAELLAVSPRTVTGLVDGLVATGFVTREPHPTDRRAINVTLTDHGARIVKELARQQDEFVALLFGDMPDRQLDGFVEGLTVVLDRIREHVP